MFCAEGIHADLERQQIFLDLSSEMPRTGVLCIVGPGGAGKSTLVRNLVSQWASSDSVKRDSIFSRVVAQHPGAERLLRWVPQHAALNGFGNVRDALDEAFRHQNFVVSTETWLEKIGIDNPASLLATQIAALPKALNHYLAVMIGLEGHAEIFLVDEPTADMDHAQRERVLSRLAEIKQKSSLLLVTHNRQDCLLLGGDIVLLAGRKILERAPTERFFRDPATVSGRQYVDTGCCNAPPLEADNILTSNIGPWWVIPGLLGGMSRPGLTEPASMLFDRLVEANVQILVCLEERCTNDITAARTSGLEHHHFAIPDMGAPSFSQAVDICRLTEPVLRRNQGVVVHCRGGLGRTGTVLAALLTWFGDSPEDAISSVRAARPFAIQSPTQLRFIHDFAERIRDWH